MVALPMSFLITFVAMWALGYSINNLTLMALTLAIGFLVDDAIVFLENVVRRAEARRIDSISATMNSAGEISFTILSMTLSLAAVFIPLAFMPGLLGRIFREFAITHHRRHSRLRFGLTHAHAADVLAHSRKSAVPVIARHGRSVRRRALLQSDSRCLRSDPRLVSRSRLDRRCRS